MKRILPPTYFYAAIALEIALHFLIPIQQMLGFPWRLIGLIPLVMGIALNLLADREFTKNSTTVKPFEESSALVMTGVFRISRNPMYLGMSLILLGLALLLGSLSPFVIVLVMPIVFDRIFVLPEECMLTETFGDQFAAYREHVRRWI